MVLPGMVNRDYIVKGRQTAFGGMNHTIGAGDGEIFQTENLTSDCYPVLATRAKRYIAEDTVSKPNGMFGWDKLAWVDGTAFFYDGVQKGTVADSKKRFAAIGKTIVIMPDKAYYNTETDTFGSLEASWSGTGVTFTDGKLFDETAKANTITVSGVRWEDYFKAGDAVTISGCTKHAENNKTPVIREIDGDKLYFYENGFKLDGENADQTYTESGTVTITRSVPELDYLCENENRLWGCRNNTIYACKLGDPFNWNVFDGLSTDSWAADTGSPGQFTGCVSYLGYPIFFKEDHIYKVYGSIPSNFEVMSSATMGVAEGAGDSIAIANETLFYLSRTGFVAYSGGIPRSVHVWGTEQAQDAVAGSDGTKYYVSFRMGGAWQLCAYDALRGMWHREDETRITAFARCAGRLYAMTDDGVRMTVGTQTEAPDGFTEEKDFEWSCEFADATENSANRKGIAKLQIRLELGAWASCRAELQFDSDGEWIQAGQAMQEGKKKSYYLPVVPRRCDHYRLRLSGTGMCRVYSIAREYYEGSEIR